MIKPKILLSSIKIRMGKSACFSDRVIKAVSGIKNPVTKRYGFTSRVAGVNREFEPHTKSVFTDAAL